MRDFLISGSERRCVCYSPALVQVRALRSAHPTLDIQVDGGVTPANIEVAGGCGLQRDEIVEMGEKY